MCRAIWLALVRFPKQLKNVLVLSLVSSVFESYKLELWAHDEGRSVLKAITPIEQNCRCPFLFPSNFRIPPSLPLVAGRSTRDTTDSLPQSMLTQGKQARCYVHFRSSCSLLQIASPCIVLVVLRHRYDQARRLIYVFLAAACSQMRLFSADA